jgi:hypothetical protein
LTCVARVIDHYDVEAEVAAAIEWIYQRLQSEGFINEHA